MRWMVNSGLMVNTIWEAYLMCNSESTAGRQPSAGAYCVTDNLNHLLDVSVCVRKERWGKEGRKAFSFAQPDMQSQEVL